MSQPNALWRLKTQNLSIYRIRICEFRNSPECESKHHLVSYMHCFAEISAEIDPGKIAEASGKGAEKCGACLYSLLEPARTSKQRLSEIWPWKLPCLQTGLWESPVVMTSWVSLASRHLSQLLSPSEAFPSLDSDLHESLVLLSSAVLSKKWLERRASGFSLCI